MPSFISNFYAVLDLLPFRRWLFVVTTMATNFWRHFRTTLRPVNAVTADITRSSVDLCYEFKLFKPIFSSQWWIAKLSFIYKTMLYGMMFPVMLSRLDHLINYIMHHRICKEGVNIKTLIKFANIILVLWFKQSVKLFFINGVIFTFLNYWIKSIKVELIIPISFFQKWILNQKEYEKKILEFSIKNQLKYKGNIGKKITLIQYWGYHLFTWYFVSRCWFLIS